MTIELKHGSLYAGRLNVRPVTIPFYKGLVTLGDRRTGVFRCDGFVGSVGAQTSEFGLCPVGSHPWAVKYFLSGDIEGLQEVVSTLPPEPEPTPEPIELPQGYMFVSESVPDTTNSATWALNPWVPMDRPIDVKHIGKLLEELGEAVSAAARCLIQGIDEADPVTGKINRQWLEDELADVTANIELNIEHFKLAKAWMWNRVSKKKLHLGKWHKMLGTKEPI